MSGTERPVMSAEAVESALWSAWARQTCDCFNTPEKPGPNVSPNWPHPTKTFWEDAMSSLESRWETIQKEHREAQADAEEPVQEGLDAFA